MTRKLSEQEFASLCAKLNIWCHKWRDVMTCPICHQPIFATNRTDSSEQTSIVDYIIFIGSMPMWVECKGTNGHNRLPFNEFEVKQVNFLKSWQERDVATSIFVTLGPGRAPNGRKAWWMDWAAFRSAAKLCLQENQKSLAWSEEDRLDREIMSMDQFGIWELVWESGGWTIPEAHPYYEMMKGLPALYDTANTAPTQKS